MGISNLNSIYNQEDKEGFFFNKRILFEIQNKYSSYLTENDLSLFYDENKRSFSLKKFFAVSTFTPFYSSTDIGGVNYWPCVLYADCSNIECFKNLDIRQNILFVTTDSSSMNVCQLYKSSYSDIVEARFSVSKNLNGYLNAISNLF